jgi:uncharacterized protein (TIGR03437 family)
MNEMIKLARLASLIAICGGLASAQTLTITTTSLPPATTGSQYSTILAASGGSTPYTWSAANLPPSFSMSTTGVLTGAPGANGAGTFSVVVTVTDAASHSVSVTFTLTVNAGFVITTQTLPNGSLGVAYSQTLHTSGGTPPVTFSLSPSTIFSQNNPPPGLGMNSGGVLSGTPTKAGSFTFQVTAIDSVKNLANATYTITIGTALVLTTASPLPSGVAGTPYSQLLFASGGTPPYTFSIVGNPPPGLSITASGNLTGTPSAIGTFPFTVQATDNRQITATKQYQVTFAAGASALQTSAIAVDFNALIGGDVPAAQSLTITSTGQSAVNYAVSVDGGGASIPAPSWLTVTPVQGSTPARLTLSVTQGSMQAGNLTAALHISVPGNAAVPPITVAVTFEVFGGAPQLEVVPSILTFASRSQAPGGLSQVLVLRNSGGSGNLPVTISSPKFGSNWITSVTPATVTTAMNSPILVQVQVNTTGLSVGHYRDAIDVAWLGGTIEVPVTLFVSDAGPILDLSLKGIRFQTQGGSSFNTGRVSVVNRGDPASTINWTAAVLTGQGWLTLPTASGTATTTIPGVIQLQAGVNVGGLPPGPSYALVRVADPLALNSPQYLAAVLDEGAASTAPVPVLDPSGMAFSAPAGSTRPLIGQVTVGTSSSSTVPYQATVYTTDGANWLTISPAAGSVSTLGSTTMTISANPTGLTGGFYTGEVDIALGTELRTMNVTLVVTSQTTAVCSPSRLTLTPAGLTSNFSVPVGWAETLRVLVNSDCGDPIQDAFVTASFSNGDTPVALVADGTKGSYTATWAPGIPMAQTNITLRATSANLQTATVRLIGDVDQNTASTAPPVLAKNGTLNNLNPLVGGAMAPGMVAQVFGTNLATSTGSTVVPLPSSYNGSSLLAGALSVPLYYGSPGQLTAEIPFELAPNRQYSIIASVNGALTLPDTIDVNPVAPGVASFPDGSLIAQHADFSLVDQQHPAHPGEILMMYLVGMGATQPSVSSGNPSPSTVPFAQPIAPPGVSVANQTAQISFAGMTPFSVGLYQINFQVPSGVKTGVPLNVLVTQGGVTANVTTLTLAP